MTLDPTRAQAIRIEWQTERRMLVKDMARIRGALRDVNYRLKVFFGEGN